MIIRIFFIAQANLVVAKCRIHNDASLDVSADGLLLAALVPDDRPASHSISLSVFSLDQRTLGQCLYQWTFGVNAISVSLSPQGRYVVVGLTTPRSTQLYSYPPSSNETATVAQVLKLSGRSEIDKRYLPSFEHVRNIDVCRGDDLFSLNSIRWLPGSGEGLVYGTNRGHLVICRPDCSEIGSNSKRAKNGSSSSASNTSNATSSIIRNQSATTGTQTISPVNLINHQRTLSIGTQTRETPTPPPSSTVQSPTASVSMTMSNIDVINRIENV